MGSTIGGVTADPTCDREVDVVPVHPTASWRTGKASDVCAAGTHFVVGKALEVLLKGAGNPRVLTIEITRRRRAL